MKRIAIIGASGFIGSAILKESLKRGHAVTAIVRNPEKITLIDPNLKILPGDVLAEESVSELVKGADVVISAYNPGWTNPNISNDTTKAYKSIIDGVKKAKIPRLLIVGGAGSLYVAPDKRLMDTGVIPDSFMPAIESLAGVLYHLQKEEAELDWAFFSPAGNIVPGEKKGTYRLGKDELVVNDKGESSISVEDYADAMLNEVEKPQHHMERFTIGY
jgi:hypothetical protein